MILLTGPRHAVDGQWYGVEVLAAEPLLFVASGDNGGITRLWLVRIEVVFVAPGNTIGYAPADLEPLIGQRSRPLKTA